VADIRSRFLGGGRGFVLDTAIGNPPGSSNQANYVIPATESLFQSREAGWQTRASIPVQTDVPAEPERDGDSRDGPDRTDECFRSELCEPLRSELHDVGNTYRFVEGVGGSPVHRDSEPQAVWQHGSQRSQLSL